jgi:hypothetical protein
LADISKFYPSLLKTGFLFEFSSFPCTFDRCLEPVLMIQQSYNGRDVNSPFHMESQTRNRSLINPFQLNAHQKASISQQSSVYCWSRKRRRFSGFCRSIIFFGIKNVISYLYIVNYTCCGCMIVGLNLLIQSVSFISCKFYSHVKLYWI